MMDLFETEIFELNGSFAGEIEFAQLRRVVAVSILEREIPSFLHSATQFVVTQSQCEQVLKRNSL